MYSRAYQYQYHIIIISVAILDQASVQLGARDILALLADDDSSDAPIVISEDDVDKARPRQPCDDDDDHAQPTLLVAARPRQRCDDDDDHAQSMFLGKARPWPRQRCGRKGRWGGQHERRLVSSAMHHGKLKKRQVRIEQSQCKAVLEVATAARLQGGTCKKLAKLIPQHWRSKRFRVATGLSVATLSTRRAGQRWLLPADVLNMTFGQDGHRQCSVVAAVHGVSTSHIRTFKLHTADC